MQTFLQHRTQRIEKVWHCWKGLTCPKATFSLDKVFHLLSKGGNCRALGSSGLPQLQAFGLGCSSPSLRHLPVLFRGKPSHTPPTNAFPTPSSCLAPCRGSHTAAALPFSSFACHKSQQESFQLPGLEFWTGPAGTGLVRGAGEAQPCQSKPQTKGLLLPAGHYKGCQKQWKYNIQTGCLFPCTHKDHSSSIINALGLICKDFCKNEFKPQKTSSIFMIMLASLRDGRLGCTLCFFPANPCPPVQIPLNQKWGEKMNCLKHQ